MEDKVRVGISACLLGEKVRYDGGHKLDQFLVRALAEHVEWVAVCPEVESGLPVPREPMRLVGDPDNPRLITIATGVDHTARLQRWARAKLRYLEGMDLSGFVFKSRSPSCGLKGVEVFADSAPPGNEGAGIFARMFVKRFPDAPAEDEDGLRNPVLRDKFIERLYEFKRNRDAFRGTAR